MADKNPRIDLTVGGEPGGLVRFSYAHVFNTHTNSNNGKEEYSVSLYIPKTAVVTVKAIRDWVVATKKAMFTDRKKPVPPSFWNPLRDGDTDVKQSGEGFGPAAAGHYVLNAKADAEHPPKVVGIERGTDGKLLRITEGLKSGDYGRAGITLYGYVTGDSGVGCGLRTIQLVESGEALGSTADADADFGDYVDQPDVL
jgi:Protein of unknown function (DUF2815)